MHGNAASCHEVPILILHGELDKAVGKVQSRDISGRCRLAGFEKNTFLRVDFCQVGCGKASTAAAVPQNTLALAVTAMSIPESLTPGFGRSSSLTMGGHCCRRHF